MDQIVKILHDLGLNQTFVFQFCIFVVTLIVARVLFVNKLKFVIERREDQTIKEEQNAERMFEKALELDEKYCKRIDEAYESAQHLIGERRKHVMKEEMEKYRGVEAEVDFFIERTREETGKEIEKQKQDVMGHADELAHDLMNRMAQ